jgi:hypothetical protein
LTTDTSLSAAGPLGTRTSADGRAVVPRRTGAAPVAGDIVVAVVDVPGTIGSAGGGGGGLSESGCGRVAVPVGGLPFVADGRTRRRGLFAES